MLKTCILEMPNQSVDYYINSDGTATIEFIFEFLNSPFGAPIDYIDVGLPNGEFDVSTITADVDGIPITNISEVITREKEIWGSPWFGE